MAPGTAKARLRLQEVRRSFHLSIGQVDTCNQTTLLGGLPKALQVEGPGAQGPRMAPGEYSWMELSRDKQMSGCAAGSGSSLATWEHLTVTILSFSALPCACLYISHLTKQTWSLHVCLNRQHVAVLHMLLVSMVTCLVIILPVRFTLFIELSPLCVCKCVCGLVTIRSHRV